MTSLRQRVAFNLSFAFILIVAAVYMFLAISIVPYWQNLSGSDLQSWFGGPFQGFAVMMVPTHLLSILTTFIAVFVLRNTVDRRLLIIALVSLLVCQGFNFTLFATDLNPALQSGKLSDEEALLVIDRWSFWHNVRTAAVWVSSLTMMVISIATKEQY